MQRLGVVSRHVLPASTAVDCEEPVKLQSCAAKKSKKVWYAPNKFEAYGEEEIQAVTDCLRDGWLAPGPRTEEFEGKVAAIFGKKHGVMVNSGSSGNMLGLASLGLQKGDEVITPACTFSTAVAPIVQLGLKPVFCDVIPNAYVPTVEMVLEKITPKTKCLFLPNLAGSKPDWKELRARVPKGIWLFEDSCDSITYTAETDISVISFYASHIITAGGMGGVVMFNDPKLKEIALQYRDWGRIGNNSEDMSERFGHNVDGIEYDFKFLYGVLGYNMKACEMSAAFGLAQLKKLDKFRAIRARNINRYCENLRKANTRFVLPQRHDEFDWLAFPLLYKDRKGVLQFLESNDVQIRVFFAGNITRHPAYREYLGSFPGADRVMKEGFLIGAHHGLELEDIDRVCDLLIEYDRKNGAVAAGTAETPAKERDSVSLDL
jgi:CDP-6-deoxy-D-xylo-4-hexulose-3-dehydrase